MLGLTERMSRPKAAIWTISPQMRHARACPGRDCVRFIISFLRPARAFAAAAAKSMIPAQSNVAMRIAPFLLHAVQRSMPYTIYLILASTSFASHFFTCIWKYARCSLSHHSHTLYNARCPFSQSCRGRVAIGSDILPHC